MTGFKETFFGKFHLFIILFDCTGSSLLCTQSSLQFWQEGASPQLWCTGFVALRHVESSWTRDQTHISCIGRQILNHWTPQGNPNVLIQEENPVRVQFSVFRAECCSIPQDTVRAPGRDSAVALELRPSGLKFSDIIPPARLHLLFL